MAAGTLSMVEIVKRQQERGIWFVFYNYGLMIVPFMAYFISGIAETNRAPFDLPEAESELVAGFHTEYSGFRWALYFLAEYANMFVVASVAVTLFWGGWLRPFPNVAFLELPLDAGLPFLLFAGSGLLSLRLAGRLPNPVHRLGLMGVAAVLVLIGAAFLCGKPWRRCSGFSSR
jgi:NADH-quinone oxidoreductase subunit H